MEEIKITKTDKGYCIEQGNKMSEQLCWNEMVGTIAALTMPNPNLCLQWMKEKPYVPKDGDIITCYEKSIKICKNPQIDEEGGWKFEIYASYDLSSKGIWFECSCYKQKEIRPATEEEKEILFSELAKKGKKWNADEKCLEDVWTPKDGDFVYIKSKYGVPNNEIVFIHRYTDQKGRIYSYAEYCFRGESSDKFEVLPTDDGPLAENYNLIEIRQATGIEKNRLINALHKEEMDWDAEKKEIIPYQWIPKSEEVYWSIVFSESLWKFIPRQYRWYVRDLVRLNNKLIFKTEEEAKKEAEKCNNKLNYGKNSRS